jgi:hypothetical protein
MARDFAIRNPEQLLENKALGKRALFRTIMTTIWDSLRPVSTR